MSSSDLTLIEGTVYGCRDVFEAVLSDKAINFEREAGFAIQLLSASDYAMGIARSNPQSVINAVTNIAAIGISLNPASKLAYLVPRDNAIKLDISYMGLMHIAIASGSVCWAQAKLVHEHDVFELQGFDKPPLHRFKPFDTQRGRVIGVYVVAKLPDGDFLTEPMSLDEVLDIRDRSSAWKAWITKKKSCPWVTDPGEMSRKTVVKRAYKYWPKTPRLDQAVHHLNTDGGEGLDGISATAASLPKPPAGPPAIADDLLARAEAAADAGREAFAAWWKAASGGKGGERDQLRPHIEDLKKRVLIADAKTTNATQHQEAA